MMNEIGVLKNIGDKLPEEEKDHFYLDLVRVIDNYSKFKENRGMPDTKATCKGCHGTSFLVDDGVYLCEACSMLHSPVLLNREVTTLSNSQDKKTAMRKRAFHRFLTDNKVGYAHHCLKDLDAILSYLERNPQEKFPNEAVIFVFSYLRQNLDPPLLDRLPSNVIFKKSRKQCQKIAEDLSWDMPSDESVKEFLKKVRQKECDALF